MKIATGTKTVVTKATSGIYW